MNWFTIWLESLGFVTPILSPSPDKVRVHRAFVRCFKPGCPFIWIRHYGDSRTIGCPNHYLDPQEPVMNPTFCRGCGKPLRWYRTTGGRWIPINPDPDPEGQLRVDVVRDVVYPVAKGSHKPLYRLHMETCEKPWTRAGAPRGTGG